jgi:hypothetical protein
LHEATPSACSTGPGARRTPDSPRTPTDVATLDTCRFFVAPQLVGNAKVVEDGADDPRAPSGRLMRPDERPRILHKDDEQPTPLSAHGRAHVNRGGQTSR